MELVSLDSLNALRSEALTMVDSLADADEAAYTPIIDSWVARVKEVLGATHLFQANSLTFPLFRSPITPFSSEVIMDPQVVMMMRRKVQALDGIIVRLGEIGALS